MNNAVTVKPLIFLIVLVLLGACQKDVEIPNPEEDPCLFRDSLVVPPSLRIEKLASLEFDGGIKELHFPTADIGYILGEASGVNWSRVIAFKTNNGGKDWVQLEHEPEISPNSMVFINEEEGIISCSRTGAILKTIDGGASWTKIHLDNIEYPIFDLQKDQENNLYGVAWSHHNPSALIKSTDRGQSWKILTDTTILDLSYHTLSFAIFEDQIYITGRNGQMFILTNEGEFIDQFQSGLGTPEDFRILDKNNFLFANYLGAVSSSDAGLSWHWIHDSVTEIIDYQPTGTGIFALNKSYCPTGYYQSNDLIARTTNNGEDWEEGMQITGLLSDLKDVQTIDANTHILVLDKEIFQLTN